MIIYLLVLIIGLLIFISYLLFTIQQLFCRYVQSFIYGKQELSSILRSRRF